MRCLIVVALALFDHKGRVLMAQRPEGKSLAGLWELPGGKLEAGERPKQALVREISEELGMRLSPDQLHPLTFADHDYDDFHLLMPVFWAKHDGQTPEPLEHQALNWFDGPALETLDMPAADIPLIAPLRAQMQLLLAA